MEYIYISQLIQYSRVVAPITISFIEGSCEQGSYWTKGS